MDSQSLRDKLKIQFTQALNFQKEKRPATITCPICFTDTSEPYAPLICQHAFCRDCYRAYIRDKIDTFEVLNMPCPFSDCPQFITEQIVQEMVDPQTFQKYQQRVVTKMIGRDPSIKYCPKPGCSRPFKIDPNSPFTICSCNTKICNECYQPWHEGKSCIEALDPEFREFAAQNEIKFCIICKTPVNRVQGCLHITCPVCDYQWCWECGQEYTAYHPLKCPHKWNPAPPRRTIKESLGKRFGQFFFRIIEIVVCIIAIPLLLIAMLIGFLIDFFSYPCRSYQEEKATGTYTTKWELFGLVLLVIVTWIVFSPVFWLIALVRMVLAIIIVLVLSIYLFALAVKDLIIPAQPRWKRGIFNYTPNYRPQSEAVESLQQQQQQPQNTRNMQVMPMPVQPPNKDTTLKEISIDYGKGVERAASIPTETAYSLQRGLGGPNSKTSPPKQDQVCIPIPQLVQSYVGQRTNPQPNRSSFNLY